MSRPGLLSLVVVVAWAGLACTADGEKGVASHHDAGAAVVDAGAAVVDAGVVQDAGAVADAGAVDAGVIVDAGSDAAVDAGVRATTAPSPAGPVTVFDKIMAKPKGGDSISALQESIQKSTGQRVRLVRRSARTWVLITFEPTTPPRNADDQRQLVEKLLQSGQFQAAEPDRVMTLKR